VSAQDAAYPLSSGDLTLDNSSDGRRLHDMPRKLDGEYLAALVASGDYFETLATMLEEIAFAFPMASVAQHQLQEAVTQLLHLQQDYEITKK